MPKKNFPSSLGRVNPYNNSVSNKHLNYFKSRIYGNIRFTDDASFINIIDNEEEGQIFLRDDCYYLELKRLILEKVGSDFIEVGKQYILNRID